MNHPIQPIKLVIPYIPFQNWRLGQKSCIDNLLLHFVNLIMRLSGFWLSNWGLASLHLRLVWNDVVFATNEMGVNIRLFKQVGNPFSLNIIFIWLELLLSEHLGILLHLLEHLLSFLLDLVQVVFLDLYLMLGRPVKHFELVLGGLRQELYFWEFFERLSLLFFLHHDVPLAPVSCLAHY